jgi:hypothetical protein
MVCEFSIEERALASRAKGVLSLHFAKCEKMTTAVSDLKGQCVVLESTQVLQELVCNKTLPLCHLHECYELLNSSYVTKSLPDSMWEVTFPMCGPIQFSSKVQATHTKLNQQEKEPTPDATFMLDVLLVVVVVAAAVVCLPSIVRPV